MKNIVLIGMPGSGKSTFAKMIADKLERPFVDLDTFIIQKTSMTIDDIFSMYGEKHFRDLESESIAELSEIENQVIATGGGSVLRDENVVNLSKSGVLFWLDRPIEQIASDIEISHRPLLKAGIERLAVLEKERRSIYTNAADYAIKNDRDFEYVCDTILKHCRESGLI